MLGTADVETMRTEKTSVGYLFFTFFKIGAISFGGHMALVAMVQKIMADRDRRVDHATIMEGVGLAGLLPGPLAVNVVAHIGYRVRGAIGAAVSVVAVLLPALLAMVLLSWLYFDFGRKGAIPHVWVHITGVVAAVILSAGLKLFKKEIRGSSTWNYVLCLASAVALFFVNNYWVSFGLMLVGALVAVFWKRDGAGSGGGGTSANRGELTEIGGGELPANADRELTATTGGGVRLWKTWCCLFLLGALAIQFLLDAQRFMSNILLRMASVFSGISLTLFGGGYVMIPLMQAKLVGGLHWLSLQEFVDGIAFSQATPGPILVSATFVGYKLSGVPGAIVATAAIFLPSVLLMLAMSKILLVYRDRSTLKKIMAGIKPVVTGMILCTALKLPLQAGADWAVWAVAVAAFVLIDRFSVNPALVILGTILADCVTYFLI